MRPLFIGLATLALLLFAAPALASILNFKGQGVEDEQMKVIFDVSKKQGDLRFVQDVQIKKAYFECQSSPQTSGRRPSLLLSESARIDSDNEFKIEFKDDLRHYIFKGDIGRTPGRRPRDSSLALTFSSDRRRGPACRQDATRTGESTGRRRIWTTSLYVR